MIAATNRNLDREVKASRFREDLFYRLNVIHLVVPPLRERREDIPVLIDHSLNRVAGHNDHVVRSVGPRALAALNAYSWPGNVRELENVMERLIVTCRAARRAGSTITCISRTRPP